MTARDLPAFLELFGRTAQALTIRTIPREELDSKARAYWDVLQDLPLADVTHAAQAILSTEQRLPVPAAWRQAAKRGRPSLSGGALVMPADRARELLAAEATGYEAPLCHCAECESAGVTHLPPRFVPDDDGRLYQHPTRKSPTPAGRWIHGQALRRWWHARGAFEEARRQAVVRVEMPRAVA